MHWSCLEHTLHNAPTDPSELKGSKSLLISLYCDEQDGLQSLEVTEFGIVEMVPVKVNTHSQQILISP